MGKEQELLQAVRSQNLAVVFKLVQKNGKSKGFLGSSKQKRINFNFSDYEGMAALHHAAVAGNTQMLLMLLENGAAVDLMDNRGYRPIHFAAAHGRTEAVHLLLRWGSLPNAAAADGCAPLHLSCQNGHVDVVKLLIYNHGDVNARSHEGRSPFDVACEFGRYLVVDLLLSSNLVQHQLHSRPVDPNVPEQFTGLHLAAQNGHTEVLRLLIKQQGVDINRRMPRGTCLHEAAAGGHYACAKMLLENGIDPHKTDNFGQIAAEVVATGVSCGKELKQLLQEACFAVRAEAVRDFCDLRNPNSIAFREGDSITVLEQCADGMWKGYPTSEGMVRTGFFPATAVRVFAPNSTPAERRCSGAITASDGGDSCGGPPECTYGPDEHFPPPPPPPGAMVGAPTAPGDTPPPLPPPPQYVGPTAAHPEAGMVTQAPALLTCAGGSNRNSAASVDSGRSSAHTTAGSESGRSAAGYATPHNGSGSNAAFQGTPSGPVRSSLQSMESGMGRQSYVSCVSSSSSSSLGSLDHLEGGGSGGLSGCGAGGANGNNAAMDADSAYSSTGTASARSLCVLPGCAATAPCSLRAWLQEAGLTQCAEPLLAAGYDLGTVTRMTPEDMMAAGITNPQQRKRLKAELARAAIPDGLPDFIPDAVLHWVKCLNLEEYHETLSRQGYSSIEKVMDITWEDLEDIGIQRLGHQKKIMLAIERLKRLKKGSESAAAVVSAASGCPPRPSRFHHHHHHHHQPTLHTPPPAAPNNAAASNVTLTPKRTPRHPDMRTFPQPPPSPSTQPHPQPQPQHSPVAQELPASPRTAVVQPTVSSPAPSVKATPTRLPLPPAAPSGDSTRPPATSAKPVAKIPAMAATGQSSSLERKRQPPPPPPKRITSMKSGSASPQGSPVRRHASPAAPRRHNYENMKTPTKPDVALLERRKPSFEANNIKSLEQQLLQQQQLQIHLQQELQQQKQQLQLQKQQQQQDQLHKQPDAARKESVTVAPHITGSVNSSSEKRANSAEEAKQQHSTPPSHQAVISPRRCSIPVERRSQGASPHMMLAGHHRARRSPEMIDDSYLAQGDLGELKSRSSSTLSVESNSLPFANENVGTIKQRSSNASKPSLSSLDFYASLDLNVGSYTSENGTIRRKGPSPVTLLEHNSPQLGSPRKCPPPPVPRRKDSQGAEEPESFDAVEEQEQLNDICDMLEDLSDMLEREIADDDSLRVA